MSTLSFAVSKEDAELIRLIAGFAHDIARENGVEYPKFEAIMDLTACHANGTLLKLEELLEWSAVRPFDFSHDVFGIRKNIDRETGKLGNCFLPRCARLAKP